MRAYTLLRDHADLALAVVLALVMEVEVWMSSFAEHRPLLAVLALLATLPLALRCTYPLAVFLTVSAALAVIGTAVAPEFDDNTVVYVFVFVFVLYSYGANARGRQAWAAVVLIPALVAAFVRDDGDAFHPGDILFGALLVGGPWAAGLAIRLRRQGERRLTARTVELEREREEKARAAVVEERARIARELHDVVAHAISVVVVQARGGRRMLDHDLAEARTAFDTIEASAGQALGEMRRLLGLLRADDEDLPHAPQPTLARLDALAAQVQGAGLPVEVEVTGTPVDLPPGVDLSAYRIVQEALTNALKHAGPARARVVVRFGADELELEIIDDGAGSGNGAGSGHGLIGVRERVAVVGGEVEAGPRSEGGFAVRARLPYAVER